jgi:hypothetical protein
MDWEYYIDNDFANAIVRGGIFFASFKFLYNNVKNKIHTIFYIHNLI